MPKAYSALVSMSFKTQASTLSAAIIHAAGKPLKLFLWVAAASLLPSAAFAYNLSCAAGMPTGGSIFIGVGDCNTYGLFHVFSGLNCRFQSILNEIMSRMYCGLQFYLEPFLKAMILLYVVGYALMFTFGIAQLTASELVSRLLRIAIIWVFAMNASWGIGMAFYFLVGGLETIVTWIFSTLDPSMDVPNFFFYLDTIIYDYFIQRFSTSGKTVMLFFVVMIAYMPPVAMLFFYFLSMMVSTFARALVSYLLGLASIAFMLSLGPIFVSLALFRSTYTFFESWLRYLISFAMQILLIFAAIALWLMVMQMLAGGFFEDLVRMIGQYNAAHNAAGINNQFIETPGVCLFGDAINCQGDLMPPGKFATDGQFIQYLTANLLAICLLVFAFNTMLKNIPEIATQLAGPKFAPQLGGGTGFGTVEMPGFTGLGHMKHAAFNQAWSTVGGTLTKARAGGAAAWEQFQRNVGINPADPNKSRVARVVDNLRDQQGKR